MREKVSELDAAGRLPILQEDDEVSLDDDVETTKELQCQQL